MSGIRVIRPGEPLEGLDDRDVRRLEDIGAIARTDRAWAFVGPGIVSLRGLLTVVLPRPYVVHNLSDLCRIASTLIACLQRYRASTQRAVRHLHSAVTAYGSVGELDAIGRLHAALELVAEDAEHGHFVLSSTLPCAHTGRIHWSRTMTRFPPVDGPSGAMHARVLRQRVRPDPEHPLCVAHRHTLGAARALLATGIDPGHAAESKAILQIVEAHRHREFSDRTKRLLSLMIRFHAQKSMVEAAAHTDLTAMIATSFHVVWERMLQCAFAPLRPTVLPQGRYLRTAKGPDEPKTVPLAAGANLLTDLIIEDGGDLFVLDAKDYAPGSFPHTADITKQILYRIMHSQVFDTNVRHELRQTYSAFLFPAQVEGPTGVRPRAVHRLHADPMGWGDIAGLDVDIERVSRAYLSGRGDPLLRASVLTAVRDVNSSV